MDTIDTPIVSQFYEVLDDADLVTSSTVATPEFMAMHYPAGNYRVVEAITATATRRRITRLAFDNRFSQAESVGLEIACLDNPAATMQQRQLSAALRASQRKVDRATYIDLDRADTRQGVMTLEAVGILPAGRALQILDAPVQDNEVYKE